MKILSLKRLAVGLFAAAGVLSSAEPASRIPILQTYTDATSTRIVVMAPDALDADRFQVVGKGEPAHIEVTRYKNPYTGGEVAHVDVSEMTLGTRYKLRVLSSDLRRVIDEREFAGLRPKRHHLKLSLASCAYDKMYRPQVWKRFNEAGSEAILFLGDNVYANRPVKIADEAQLWMRYTQTRQKFSFFYTPKLIPSFSTWDDHDTGVNNGGKDYPLLKTVSRIFGIFFGSPLGSQATFVKGPGISYVWKTPQGLWVFFDNRSFRDDPQASHKGAYLGREQLKWFARQIQESSGTHLFLIGGSKFFEKQLAHQEGYEQDYPHEFGEFLTLLRKHKGRVSFLSGDRHYSEISEVLPQYLGYKAFEITSSAMHSYTFALMLVLNKNRHRLMGTPKENFVILDLKTKRSRLEATATSRGEKRDLFVWKGML